MTQTTSRTSIEHTTGTATATVGLPARPIVLATAGLARGPVWRGPQRRGRVWRTADIGPVGTLRPVLAALPG